MHVKSATVNLNRTISVPKSQNIFQFVFNEIKYLCKYLCKISKTENHCKITALGIKHGITEIATNHGFRDFRDFILSLLTTQ